MDNLFAYGSLMVASVLRRVIGADQCGVPASLHDYERKAVIDEDYPAIVPQAGAVVTGVLYSELTPEAMRRLDVFEGEMYRRVSVFVDLPGSLPVEAQAYVIRPAFVARVSGQAWNYEAFMRIGKRRFETEYFGFDALKDVT